HITIGGYRGARAGAATATRHGGSGDHLNRDHGFPAEIECHASHDQNRNRSKDEVTTERAPHFGWRAAIDAQTGQIMAGGGHTGCGKVGVAEGDANTYPPLLYGFLTLTF